MWKQTSKRRVKGLLLLVHERAFTSTRQSLTKKRKSNLRGKKKKKNLASRMVPELTLNVRFALLLKPCGCSEVELHQM